MTKQDKKPNIVGMFEFTKEDALAYLKELGVTVYTQEEVDKIVIEFAQNMRASCYDTINKSLTDFNENIKEQPVC